MWSHPHLVANSFRATAYHVGEEGVRAPRIEGLARPGNFTGRAYRPAAMPRRPHGRPNAGPRRCRTLDGLTGLCPSRDRPLRGNPGAPEEVSGRVQSPCSRCGIPRIVCIGRPTADSPRVSGRWPDSRPPARPGGHRPSDDRGRTACRKTRRPGEESTRVSTLALNPRLARPA